MLRVIALIMLLFVTACGDLSYGETYTQNNTAPPPIIITATPVVDVMIVTPQPEPPLLPTAASVIDCSDEFAVFEALAEQNRQLMAEYKKDSDIESLDIQIAQLRAWQYASEQMVAAQQRYDNCKAGR